MIRAVTALGQAARARQVTPVARPGRSRVRKARAGRAARVRPDRTSRQGSRGEQQAPEDDRAMRRPHIPRAGTRARCAATSESARSHRRRAGAPRRGRQNASALSVVCALRKHANTDVGSTIEAHSRSDVVCRWPAKPSTRASAREPRQTNTRCCAVVPAACGTEDTRTQPLRIRPGLAAFDLPE